MPFLRLGTLVCMIANLNLIYPLPSYHHRCHHGLADTSLKQMKRRMSMGQPLSYTRFNIQTPHLVFRNIWNKVGVCAKWGSRGSCGVQQRTQELPGLFGKERNIGLLHGVKVCRTGNEARARVPPHTSVPPPAGSLEHEWATSLFGDPAEDLACAHKRLNSSCPDSSVCS